MEHQYAKSIQRARTAKYSLPPMYHRVLLSQSGRAMACCSPTVRLDMSTAVSEKPENYCMNCSRKPC
jgi:hypothetical protein